MLRRLALGRNLASLFFVGVIVSLVVAACGGGEEATPVPPAPTTAPTATRAPTPTTAPTATPVVVERTVVVTPTPVPPTAVPAAGAITERINGFRWIQNQPNWRVPPQRGGTHNYAFNTQIAGLDPLTTRSFTTMTHATVVYSQLVRCQVAPNQKVGDIGICEVAPDLADSWSVGGDGKTWTFKLNQKAKWQNPPATAFGYDAQLRSLYGRDFTSADVVASVDMWLGKATKADGTLVRPGPGDWGNIASARAVDPDTVIIEAKVADPFFVQALTDFQTRILPPEVLKLDGDFTKRMVGTGAFFISVREAGVKTEFTANPDFWRNAPDGKPLPYVDKHVIAIIPDASRGRAALITGQVDSAQAIGVDTPTGAINFGRDCPSCQIIEMFTALGVFSIGFKTEGDGAPFANPKARLAVAKAIDWASILQNVHDGAAAMIPATNVSGLIFDDLPTLPVYQKKIRDGGVKDEDNPFVFDAALAKKLWAESGHKEGEKHSIIYNEYSTLVTRQIIAVAGELKKVLNIDVEVNKAPDINVYYSAIGFLGGQKHQNFPSMAMYFNNVLPTNAGSIASIVPPEQRNFPEFNNPRINALAAEIVRGVPLEREKAISTEVFIIEHSTDLRRLVLPSGARFITYGPRLRNAYQQSRGGEAFHQGGHLAEVIWLAR